MNELVSDLSAGKTLLGQLAARDAEILQSRLSKHGIDVVAIFSHSTCKTGCTPSKEIWAHPEDVQAIQSIMMEERLAALKDLGADLSLLNEVFDPAKESATCPACGTGFHTSLTDCPECGLVIGGS